MTQSTKILVCTIWAAIAFSGCAGANSTRGASVEQIGVDAANKNNALEITVLNKGNDEVSLHSPLALAPLPDEPGLEFVLQDSDGKRRELCAFVEPSSDGELMLQSGASKSRNVPIGDLARLFCLERGQYSVRVILHLRDQEHLKQVQSRIVYFHLP